MDKKSPNYVKSSYDEKLYGDDSYTTFERNLSIDGNNSEKVSSVTPHIKSSVMP